MSNANKWRQYARFLFTARRNLIEAWPDHFYRLEFGCYKILNQHFFLVNYPEGVHHVMVGQATKYRKSPANTQALKPILGDGIFVSEGDLWRRQRNIMNPTMHKNHMQGYGKIIVETVAEMLSAWQCRGPAFSMIMDDEMSTVTAEVITRTMFGDLLESRSSTVLSAFQEYLKTHGRVHITELLGLPETLPRPGQRRAKKAVEKFDTVILEIIEKKREKLANRTPDHEGLPDLLDLLLMFRDEHDSPMQGTLVRDEVASIFLAGHETTAITMTWAFYLLHKHPEIAERVHEEVDRHIQKPQDAWDAFPQLVYCRAVVDEVLRLYPPVHVFSRQAIEDDQLRDRRIPKGSYIAISSWLLHRHEKYWNHPELFHPDRFLPENRKSIEPYTYIPFGAGPRICLGKNLGQMEAVMLFALIARHHRLRPVNGEEVKPVGRLTLRPNEPIHMNVTRR